MAQKHGWGQLSSNAERYMQWRTIDGVTLDPLGQFNELETMVRGVFAPQYFLDYLRFFVLFEDDGTSGEEDCRLSPIPCGTCRHYASRYSFRALIINPRKKAKAVWCGIPKAVVKVSP